MNPQHEATADWAIKLWASMMSDDFSEIRAHWYPAETPMLQTSRGRGADSSEMLESSFETNVVQCVWGAVRSLTAPQRGSLERYAELTAVCRVPHYEDRLAEAKMKIWLALVSSGSAS